MPYFEWSKSSGTADLNVDEIEVHLEASRWDEDDAPTFEKWRKGGQWR